MSRTVVFFVFSLSSIASVAATAQVRVNAVTSVTQAALRTHLDVFDKKISAPGGIRIFAASIAPSSAANSSSSAASDATFSQWGALAKLVGRRFALGDGSFATGRVVSPTRFEFGQFIFDFVGPHRARVSGSEFTIGDEGWALEDLNNPNPEVAQRIAYWVDSDGNLMESRQGKFWVNAGWYGPKIVGVAEDVPNFGERRAALMADYARDLANLQSGLRRTLAENAQREADYQARRRKIDQEADKGDAETAANLAMIDQGFAQLRAQIPQNPSFNRASPRAYVAPPPPPVVPTFSAPTYRAPPVPTALARIPRQNSGVEYTAPANGRGQPYTPPSSNGGSSNQPAAQGSSVRVGSLCVSYDGINLVNGCSFPVSARFCLTGANQGDWAAQFTCPNTGQVGPMPPGERRSIGRGHAYWLACEERGLFFGVRWTGAGLRMERCG